MRKNQYNTPRARQRPCKGEKKDIMKNYTIQFFTEKGEEHTHEGKRYYLMIINNAVKNKRIGKFINVNDFHEMRQIMHILRTDRSLFLGYVFRNPNKYLDNVTDDLKTIINDFYRNASENYNLINDKGAEL